MRGIEFACAQSHHGLRGGHIALARDHLGLGTGDRSNSLLGLRLRLVALRVEHVNLHLCQHLAGFHKIAFVHHDFLHAPGELGSDVNLGGLDATVAADEAFTRAGRFQSDPSHYRDHCDNDGDGCPD